MRLGLFKKLKELFREKLSLGKDRVLRDSGSTGTEELIDRTAIVLKERKRSVQIMCWHCSHRLWVLKGSRCHTLGLCSKCIGNFDRATGTVKKAK